MHLDDENVSNVQTNIVTFTFNFNSYYKSQLTSQLDKIFHLSIFIKSVKILLCVIA